MPSLSSFCQKVWHDPVWSNVFAFFICTVMTFLGTLAMSLAGGADSVREVLLVALRYKVNVWLALAVFALLSVGWTLWRKRIERRPPVLPFVEGFTQGTYQNQLWRWRWQWSEAGKFYYVSELSIVCPDCRKGLLTLGLMYYRCSKCNADIPYRRLNTLHEAAANQILDDARRQYPAFVRYLGKAPQDAS